MMFFGPPNIEKLKGKGNVKGLIKALRSHVGDRAAAALAQIGDARAVEPLIAALKYNIYGVPGAAAVALGQIGDARAVEPLIAMLSNSDSEKRDCAKTALGQIGDPRAVEPLIAALGSRDRVGTQALVKIGPPAVEPLIPLLKNSSDGVCLSAASALRQIGDARAVEPLIAALSYHTGDDFYNARAVMIRALVEVGGARAVEPLIASLTDRDLGIRQRAAEALAEIGDARAVEPLTAALSFVESALDRCTLLSSSSTRHYKVKEAIEYALRTIQDRAAHRSAQG